MSTRREVFKRLSVNGGSISTDSVETVALVVRAQRELLLAAHSYRLNREDLEDCYSQATVELLKRAKHDPAFSGRAHIANALEQRFLSRVRDRHRAIGGRSPIEAAVASALPLGAWDGGVDVPDARLDIERLVLSRHDLGLICRLARQLSPDQRLVLKSQLASGVGSEEFCREHGWSEAKYRKVGQRARARLAALLARESEIDPDRLEKSFTVRCPAVASSSD